MMTDEHGEIMYSALDGTQLILRSGHPVLILGWWLLRSLDEIDIRKGLRLVPLLANQLLFFCSENQIS